MKILFVLEHFHPYIGGSEKLFYKLTSNLAANGFEITVVTTLHDKNLKKVEQIGNLKIVRINCYNRFGFTILSLPKIIRFAKDCNLIHTTTYNAALPSLIAGKLLGKPIIVTFHEVWGDLWKKLPFISYFQKNAFYLFEKLLLKLPFSTFIAVSEFTKMKLEEAGISKNKIVRIYNGIDYNNYKNEKHVKPKEFTYTYFGRLGISKGLNLLIEAAVKFKETYPQSKLKLIIPKQPKGIYKEIMKLITINKLNSYIEFHHNLSKEKLNEELMSSSCVVIPSYSEGFCYAAAETIAMEIPLISSHLGALKEVVSGKYIKMEQQNTKGLYDALEKAYRNEWIQDPIKHFNLDVSVTHYSKLYSTILE